MFSSSEAGEFPTEGCSEIVHSVTCSSLLASQVYPPFPGSECLAPPGLQRYCTIFKSHKNLT